MSAARKPAASIATVWPSDDHGTAGMIGQVRRIADLVTSPSGDHSDADILNIDTAFRLGRIQIEIELERRRVLRKRWPNFLQEGDR